VTAPIRAIGLCAGLALLLSGCATPSGQGPSGDASDVPRLQLTGRFAAQYQPAGESSLRSVSGRFEWIELPGKLTIDLATPLGATLARIESDSNRTTLKTASGELFEAATAEDLTSRALGWRLPVSGLRFWLRGQSDPQKLAHLMVDDGGRRTLEQDGWRVQTLETFEAADKPCDSAGCLPARPARLNLERVDAAEPRLQLKLVIDRD
jgi:outer membrane lipoprotein LolB